MADKTILVQTPYSTTTPYVAGRTAADWADTYDAQRLLSYDLYDDLYFNDPTQFRMMLRGSDERPLLVPTAKSIVNSLARYVGRNWGFKVNLPVDDEDGVTATPEQVTLAQIQLGKLFARERLLSVYRSGVAEWLRRGDWLWFLSADENKPAGRRISVTTVDPRRYFPMFNDVRNVSRVTGQQFIEETMVGDTVCLYVQTWVKASDPLHADFGDVEPDEGFDIMYQAETYEAASYAEVEKRKKISNPDLDAPLDYVSGIKTLPVYHIRNNETTEDPFGRSDLSGLEPIVAGVNQALSDEDLSLAMMGLGMYWTDSGAPVDETTGQPTNWKLGPRRVVEVDEGTSFNKVDGITSVEPFQSHVDRLKQEAHSSVGLSDVSVGTTDNANAESGRALAIRFSPTQDAVRSKNDTSNGVLTQMLHDLKDWFRAFEQIDMGDVDIVSGTDDQNLLPFDREQRWKELMEGISAGVFTEAYAVSVLQAEFGYQFPSDYLTDLETSNNAKAALADPFAARANAELSAEDDDLGDESDDSV